MESVIIPDSVTTIEDYAFDTLLIKRDENGNPVMNEAGTNFISAKGENGNQIYNLKSLVIPDTLETVAIKAFG